MDYIQCQQGTEEWLQARSGLITASKVKVALSRVGELDEKQSAYVNALLSGISEKAAMDIAGYKTSPRASGIEKALRGEPVGDWSDPSKAYAAQVAIERISGKPSDEGFNSWQMKRGQEMEPLARIAYESQTGYMATESGVMVSDDRLFGYSSDGLIDDPDDGNGLLEIKALISAITVLEMWRTGDMSEFMHQMQTGLWMSGRKWIDFVMFCPQLESVGKSLFIRRVERDDEFIDKMVNGLAEFEKLVCTYEQILRG